MRKIHVDNRITIVGILVILMTMFICTLFAADEKTGILLVEHPWPDFMREAWDNLNGQWDFALDPDETGEKDGWFNAIKIARAEGLRPSIYTHPSGTG